jgi:hypothetical protein
MAIKYLVQAQPGAILAIDADPSSNLNMVLGLELEWTVGEIREDLLLQVKDSLTAGGAAMGSLQGGDRHGPLRGSRLLLCCESQLARGGRFYQ